MSVNKAIIVGRLGNDPDIRDIGNTGDDRSKCAVFSLATNEQWKDKDGNKQERAEWHRIVCWGKTAVLAHKYLKKGHQVYIEGRLQTRDYVDKNDVKRYTTEIICTTMNFLESANSGARPPHPGEQQERHSSGPEPVFDSTEEIPL